LNPFQQAKQSPLMKNGSAVDIVTIIDRGLVLLGIKGQNVPAVPEKQMFVIELKSQYPNITIGELDFAFRLASRGKLDFDAETYQNFSMLYLNRMLSSYARYIMREYLSKTQKPVEQQKQIPEQSKNELDNEMLAIGFRSFIRFRKWDAIPAGLTLFKFLWDHGELEMIPIEFVVSETERELKLKCHTIVDPDERREMKQKMLDDDFMELQCRRMAVAIYFKNLIEANENLPKL
jgi:hypothetical protein